MKKYFFFFILLVEIQIYSQTFGPKMKFDDLHSPPLNSVFTDIEGDGINELFLIQSGLKKYERVYCDQFDFVGIIEPEITGYPIEILRVDIDGDGIEDLFCGTTTNLYWLKVNPDGTLGEENIIVSTGTGLKDIEIADFDMDGDQDISWFNEGIFFLENSGGGIFGVPSLVDGDFGYYHDFKSGDLNSDGFQDLILITSLGEVWYPNLGDGSFGTPDDLFELIDPSTFTSTVCEILDIDGDGDLDVALAQKSESKKNGWAENNGLGEFEIWHDLTPPLLYDRYYGFMHFVDFDMDGLEDVFWNTFDDDQLLQWRKNLGGGEFSEPIVLPFVLFEYYWMFPDVFKDLYPADYDSDGDYDIIMIFYGEGGYYVLENLSTNATSIKGRIYVDLNENGINDVDEPGAGSLTVTLDGGDVRAYTNEEGFYQFTFCEYLPEDTLFEVFPVDLGYWSIVSDSLLYHAHVGSLLPPIDNLDFGIFADTIADDIAVSLTGDYSSCIPHGSLWLELTNLGTTYPSGVIHLTIDEALSYISAAVLPDSIIGQDIYWHYDSLPYFETFSIMVNVDVADDVMIGDTLHSLLIGTVDSLADGIFAEDEVWDIATCSYDPNRKTVTPAGLDSLGFISPTVTYLEYEIRFQNTGTDVAHNVMILDQLDENLDWSTFDFISASHAVEIEIGISGQLVLNYNDIMLPDSSVSATESIGYFKYGINLKPDVPIGASIYNSAAIYFDANPPITTNQTISTIICSDFIDIDIEPFDKDTICIESIDEIELIASPFGGEFSGEGVEDDLFLPLLAGMGNHTIYYSITDEYGCVSVDSAAIYVTDCLGLQENEIYQIKVYPNPFDEFTTVYFGNNLTENHLILVHDLLGKEIYRNEAVSGEKFELRINERGVYTVSLYSNFNAAEIFTAKLVVE